MNSCNVMERLKLVPAVVPPTIDPKSDDECLAAKCKILEQKNQDLEIGVYHWKLTANEANDRLRRMVMNKNKPNYIAIFYDLSVKKLLEAIIEENLMLKESAGQGSNDFRTKCNCGDMTLTDKLAKRLRIDDSENDRSIENIQNYKNSRNQNKDVRKNKFKRVHEETSSKNMLLNKIDVMTYLENLFTKERKELLQIFSQCHSKFGNDFIDQLKSLDSAMPDFLSKPLMRDTATNTGNDDYFVNLKKTTNKINRGDKTKSKSLDGTTPAFLSKALMRDTGTNPGNDDHFVGLKKTKVNIIGGSMTKFKSLDGAIPNFLSKPLIRDTGTGNDDYLVNLKKTASKTNGENIAKSKSLDIPEFLSKPLMRDTDTNTQNNDYRVNLKKIKNDINGRDRVKLNKDSGICFEEDGNYDLKTMKQKLPEAHRTIANLEESVDIKENAKTKLLMSVIEKNKSIKTFQNSSKAVEMES